MYFISLPAFDDAGFLMYRLVKIILGIY